MANRHERIVLFLGAEKVDRIRFCEILFNAVSQKMGLPWKAASATLAPQPTDSIKTTSGKAALLVLQKLNIRECGLLDRVPGEVTSSQLDGADRVIALDASSLQGQFSVLSDSKIEFWQFDNAISSFDAIETEMMKLVARIAGGGERKHIEEVPALPPPNEIKRKPQIVKVGRETAGRRGKGVTTVFDVPLNEAALRELAATLKDRCGTGGTVKDGRIEIQGDQRERLTAILESLGYRVKRAGG